MTLNLLFLNYAEVTSTPKVLLLERTNDFTLVQVGLASSWSFPHLHVFVHSMHQPWLNGPTKMANDWDSRLEPEGFLEAMRKRARRLVIIMSWPSMYLVQSRNRSTHRGCVRWGEWGTEKAGKPPSQRRSFQQDHLYREHWYDVAVGSGHHRCHYSVILSCRRIFIGDASMIQIRVPGRYA